MSHNLPLSSSFLIHFVLFQLNPEKLKGMSKKQLRSVRKTSVNQFGQVELVSPYGGVSDNAKSKVKKSRR